jgi:hypothetical protein
MLRMFNIVLSITIFSVLGRAGETDNPARDNSQLSVCVYNDAKAPAPELARAERQTENILGRAGLRVNWPDCRAASHNSHNSAVQSGPRELFLRIIPGSNHLMGDSVFGVAFLSGNGSGQYSDIFYERSLELHRDWGVDVGGILGAIIAHEIGHLLLGSNAHAAIGIMRAHWQGAELRLLSKGQLLFTPEQGARMRTNLVQEERTAETRLATGQGGY